MLIDLLVAEPSRTLLVRHHLHRPVNAPFWTPGVLVMVTLMIGGALVLLARYVGGLGYATNLSDAYPWGLWIAIDVASGVALAAGGFTTAFLAHILHRDRYRAIIRPALLTAALGYTFVAIGVFVDIGRSWAIWKFFLFQNHLSALFEVGMCVLAYLTVLWIEFIPVVAERFGGRFSWLGALDRVLSRFLWVFLVLGVVLSCMHQSSLGTMLLIAPTKISPLWYTPLLPLLFLISAFAVGFPMVIVETTVITSSLQRDGEMRILSPLSRITVWLLGLYLVLKIGDLVARGAYVTLLDGSAQSMAFLVEVGLGVIVPLFPLQAIREPSSGFERTGAGDSGAMTKPMHASRTVRSVLLVVAALVTLHPGPVTTTEPGTVSATVSRGNQHPRPDGWVALDHEGAVAVATKQPVFVDRVLIEDLPVRTQRLRRKGLGVRDIEHSYLWLESPFVNTYEDLYEPVRFMHSRHAASLGGDCATCHHYRPADPEAAEVVACSACHQRAFESDHPGRIGLKAAYHMQCMGCHEKAGKGPVDCEGCHLTRVPDHRQLVELPPDPAPIEVTRECLRCHEEEGRDVIASAHWLWRGPSRYTVEHLSSIACGKCSMTLNNYCLSPISNWGRCTSCHIGYGWSDASFDFDNPELVDCLVCHDTTGSYHKGPKLAGMPAPEVDLVWVAQNVGRTSRQTCGTCHFHGGGGDAVKHGDMSENLYWPSRECDVHMGGYDFQCSECHLTKNHRITGRSTSVCASEGTSACEDCHTARPHYGDSLLDHHLNRHCDAVDCNTCHSPLYAKCAPTLEWWDWSEAGDTDREVHQDRHGQPDYSWKKGSWRWQESVQPEYAWFNGYTSRLLLGDLIHPEARGFAPGKRLTEQQKQRMVITHITEPLGSFADPVSKITPFKIMEGIQPADAEHRYLLVPHLFPYDDSDTTAFWKSRRWQTAFVEGMAKAGLPYSGRHIWVRTAMYWRIEHEVMPASMALSCQHCHQSLRGSQTCDRCHLDSREVDFAALCRKGIDLDQLLGSDGRGPSRTTDYIDFQKLGYRGDPILYG
ncbi:MAG: Ni/Fe-hydrogenase cytochrome b subunit, partial [Acidobacteriota bacterium]